MGPIDHARLKQAKPSARSELGLVFRIALADYVHEKRLSIPLIISLATILTPLLVLFGLKFGIISTMSRELTQDPRSRELRPLGQARHDAAFLEELRRQPETAFLQPKTRFLAATIDLRHPGSEESQPIHAELTPSAQGDPLLGDMTVQPDGYRRIILSSAAAEALQARRGDRITGRIGRTLRNGEREVLRFDLQVAGVLPPAKSSRLEALVSLPFLLAAEDFREGYAVPELGADGHKRPRGERLYASFRLYARNIHEVAALRQWLANQGIRSDTRLGEIELLERLDHNLGILYLVIAGLGGCGYIIALTVSLWANTERKRKELSVLRLIGLRSTALAMVPCIQSVCTAVIASILAIGLYAVSEQFINYLFKKQLVSQQVLSRMELPHYSAALGITVILAVAASLVAGFRAASISPSEGLRDE